ncbi:MAG: hypothetical protein ABIQ39_14690 [Ilumatobacteraceae bacterium]
MSVQYRVVFAKNDEAVDGPDDADVVITVAGVDAVAAGADPTVAYMRGKLKSTGPTGALLDVLRSGEAAAVITRLASRP